MDYGHGFSGTRGRGVVVNISQVHHLSFVAFNLQLVVAVRSTCELRYRDVHTCPSCGRCCDTRMATFGIVSVICCIAINRRNIERCCGRSPYIKMQASISGYIECLSPPFNTKSSISPSSTDIHFPHIHVINGSISLCTSTFPIAERSLQTTIILAIYRQHLAFVSRGCCWCCCRSSGYDHIKRGRSTAPVSIGVRNSQGICAGNGSGESGSCHRCGRQRVCTACWLRRNRPCVGAAGSETDIHRIERYGSITYHICLVAITDIFLTMKTGQCRFVCIIVAALRHSGILKVCASFTSYAQSCHPCHISEGYFNPITMRSISKRRSRSDSYFSISDLRGIFLQYPTAV